MTDPQEITFQELLDKLLDLDTPFSARYLYRLSDLEEAETAKLKQIWPTIPTWRRKALMEDLETLTARDTLLSYESIARFAIYDEEPAVRLPAVHILWEFEHPDLAGEFMKVVQRDSSEEVRAASAAGLGRFVYFGEVDTISKKLLRRIENLLLSIVGGEDTKLVRRRSLESLGYSSREEIPPLIETAYNSDDKEWQASALLAMGRSYHERWHDQVMQKLESNLPLLRAEAARAAGELEMKDAAPLLLEMLDDPSNEVRSASIWSLSQIGGAGVRQTLEQLYEETDDEMEADFIEMALDNLAFTEDVELFSLFDFPEKDEAISDEAFFDFGEDEEDLSA